METSSRIRVVVPNRVDLAGGTLDIYPMYLLVPGSMTVNAGTRIRSPDEAPRGSGLGAPSSLLVATMLAMDALLGRRRGWEETARAAMEIEAGHLRCLTGRQDHVAALRGGIQGIRFLPGGMEADRIAPGSDAGRKLASHGFVAGTGKGHRSAGGNWRGIRGAVEGE